jgi:hypothetical protein
MEMLKRSSSMTKGLPLFPDDVKNLVDGAEMHSSLICLS